MGEADKWHGEPLYDAIVKKLRMMDIAGATVFRGILGYGAKGHEHKKSFFHVSRDLPIMISVIDTPGEDRAAAEVVEGMLEDGLIVVSEVEIVRLVAAQANWRRRMRPSQAAKLLRIHISESDRYQGKPLYEAIIAKCRELKIAGATRVRGTGRLWRNGRDSPLAHLIRSDRPS